MVQLRLYTYDQWGNEVVTPWAFNVLESEDEFEIPRESTAAANGDPRRRPFQEREVYTLTLGAGLLKRDAAWTNFKRLLHAHKIEWLRTVNGTAKYIEFALDEDSKVTFERIDERKRLKRKKIRLIEKKGRSFRDFEDKTKKLEPFVA